MLPLPRLESIQILRWAQDYIRPEHLADDGIEVNPHITVKYGFTGSDKPVVEALRAILTRHGPVRVNLNKLSVFADTGDGDVLKIGVNSPELSRLYYQLSSHFICVDRFYPQYNPHVTVAYLKPGFSQGYVPYRTPLDNRELFLDEMVYSGPTREIFTIPLSGQKTLSWMNPSTGGALVKPPEYKGPKPRKVINPSVKNMLQNRRND